MPTTSDDKRQRFQQWLKSGEARLQPLTFPQRELWEASPVPAADTANHICCLIHVRGLITPSDCETALRRVVRRQEVLRLSFLPGKQGPLQMIRQDMEPNIHFRELSSAEGRPEAIEEWAAEVFHQPFEFLQGPLYRVQVLQRAADDHVLVLAIHHAIADGWSLGVFVQDLCGAYLQERMGLHEALPDVPLPYTAWGAAERAFWQPAEIAQRAPHWKKTLPGRQRLWGSHGSGVPSSHRRARWVDILPAELGLASRELARRHGVTLFSTLLAIFQASLAQWTGVDDILVGTPVANRSTQAVRETMGYCAGVVPLRGEVDRKRPFADALRAVHHASADGFANALPFAELMRLLDEPLVPGCNPLFEVRFALQNHPIPEIALPTLAARLSMRSTGTARFDLGCEITEQGDALEVVWLFQPDLFTQAEIEVVHGLFVAILTKASRSPTARMEALMA